MGKKLPPKSDVRRFIYDEAKLIDGKNFDKWLDLFAEDAIYWMPLGRDQAEEDIHNSLFFEDILLLTVRVKRLSHPRAFSQQPPSYCQHVLQKPDVVYNDDIVTISTITPFIYVESHGDAQFTLAGCVYHELKQEGAQLKIFRKRIELLNREAALPSIQLFL